MAFVNIRFFSERLQKPTELAVVLPNDIPACNRPGNMNYDRPMKTCYLLHGYCDNGMDWVLNIPLNDLAARYNFCFIMPNGDNSFYLDGPETGRQYAQYVGEELVQYTRKTLPLSERVEDTYIGGYSMGGFGALHTALTYPKTFSACVALSSALIQRQVADMRCDIPNVPCNFAYYKLIFGAPEALMGSANDPETLVHNHGKQDEPLPRLYMACGTEDSLLQTNRDFHAVLQREAVPVTYVEAPGNHDFNFWSSQMEPAIQWLLALK